MDVEELAKTYAEEAVERVAVTNLYSSLDATDINSNAYQLNYQDSGGNTMAKTVTFDKYMSQWAPFIDEISDNDNQSVNEGEVPSSSRPQDIAETLAEHVYGSFKSASSNSNYKDASFLGFQKLLDDYRMYAEEEPSVVVIDDDLLQAETICGIEEIEEVEVYESEYLDLGEQILVSSDRMGYCLTRTPVDADGYHDAYPYEDEDTPIRKENPYIVQAYTRKAVTELHPEYAMSFTPFGE